MKGGDLGRRIPGTCMHCKGFPVLEHCPRGELRGKYGGGEQWGHLLEMEGGKRNLDVILVLRWNPWLVS